MDWLFSLLIALAANIDNLGVGIAYGSRKMDISIRANLIIAFLSFLATLFAANIGAFLNETIQLKYAGDLGAVILICAGLWIILGPAELIHQPEKADRDCSNPLDDAEAVLLGIALSANAVAVGLDAGLVALPILVISLFVGLFSFLTIAFGCSIGRVYLAKRLGNAATNVSGLLILAIGLYQLRC
jgi:putative Mn2+ efflux pump MntP